MLSNIEMVRLLCTDAVPMKDPRDLTKDAVYAFSDDQIEAFLFLSGNNIKRAAALALQTLAADEAFRLKVLSTDDKSTDGAKLLSALLQAAKNLREQAQAEEMNDTGFEFIPFDRGCSLWL